jgi:hypothetical protein
MPCTVDNKYSLVHSICYSLKIRKDAKIAAIPSCNPIHSRIFLTDANLKPTCQIDPVTSKQYIFSVA